MPLRVMVCQLRYSALSSTSSHFISSSLMRVVGAVHSHKMDNQRAATTKNDTRAHEKQRAAQMQCNSNEQQRKKEAAESSALQQHK